MAAPAEVCAGPKEVQLPIGWGAAETSVDEVPVPMAEVLCPAVGAAVLAVAEVGVETQSAPILSGRVDRRFVVTRHRKHAIDRAK